jgi:hypothetical protein
MKLKSRKTIEMSPARSEEGVSDDSVLTACYCPNGHNLVGDRARFDGYEGITVKLKNASREGLLSLSPIMGDLQRMFFDFEPDEREIVDICCPTCAESLPVYNLCTCGASLVSLFLSPKAEFSNCIGICQRIGCLHSEIKSNRELRLFSRLGYFKAGTRRGA